MNIKTSIGVFFVLILCFAFSAHADPGDPCGIGRILDCEANCVNEAQAISWTGDGWCDDGTYGLVLTCDYFDNDGGDCDPPPPQPGDACEVDANGDVFVVAAGVLDCNLNCYLAGDVSEAVGDGICDEGAGPLPAIVQVNGLNLNCAAFDFDGGDCAEPGNNCGDGMIYDCENNCVNEEEAESWVGDGYCDDGTWGIVLTCDEFDYDEGDCPEPCPCFNAEIIHADWLLHCTDPVTGLSSCSIETGSYDSCIPGDHGEGRYMNMYNDDDFSTNYYVQGWFDGGDFDEGECSSDLLNTTALAVSEDDLNEAQVAACVSAIEDSRALLGQQCVELEEPE